jgi:flagellar hook-length control protein FliK
MPQLSKLRKKQPSKIGRERERESPRLKEKGTKGKPIIKVAQELVARKCGIIQEKQELDSMTLQKYLDMYKKPLSDDSMEAIKKLAEIADEKVKKKKKAKKDKKKEEKLEMDKKDKMGKKAAPAGGGGSLMDASLLSCLYVTMISPLIVVMVVLCLFLLNGVFALCWPELAMDLIFKTLLVVCSIWVMALSLMLCCICGSSILFPYGYCDHELSDVVLEWKGA